MPLAHSPAQAPAAKLAATVAACRDNERLLAGLQKIYRRVDKAVAKRGYECRSCGACCRFDTAGHRLYVSAGELALLTRQDAPAPQQVRIGRCPYQVASLCTARDHRPLGCRIFFCDESHQQWCFQQYETHHRRIRTLHQEAGGRYAYGELISGLASLLGSGPAAPSPDDSGKAHIV